MCGIAAILCPRPRKPQAGLAQAMADAMEHRGPDDRGSWEGPGAALGNRRLAVLDLSAAGHMPMADPTGRYVITYNGEVYNYRELRAELEGLGHSFTTETDTEVVMRAVAQWGDAALLRLNGMFAFALHDRQAGSTLLARDRFGVKPLYYTRIDDELLAASEVKAFLKHPSFRVEVDLRALREYFTYQNLYSDRTLFLGVRMLLSGHAMRVGPDGQLRTWRWWDFDMRHQLDPVTVSPREAAIEVRRLFEQAVKRQMVSDVPLGSFLSGGMDSGSIVAVASRHVPRLRTFTAGFELEGAKGVEATFDERAAAETMAAAFGTQHYEQVLQPQDMRDVLERLIWHLEDPRVGMCWQDWCANELASRFVTVCLSGAGGDELFGGYPWRYAAVAEATDAASFVAEAYRYWQRLVPEAEHAAVFAPSVMEATAGYSPRHDLEAVLQDAPVRAGAWTDLALYLDFKTFLHGLMVVGDKLSSAHSLEQRVPFLDNDLVDYAAKLPADYKVDASRGDVHHEARLRVSNDGKLVLRDAMNGLIPEGIRLRRKQGFSPPDATWYAGPNLPFIWDTLLSPAAQSPAYFARGFVERIVDEHASGKANHRLLLWSLLSFEMWCRQFRPAEPGAAKI